MAAKPVAQTMASNGYSVPFDLDAAGRETLDRRLRHVDQFHVRQIVGFEIAGIDAQALAAEHVVGTQQLGGRRILDDGADLVAREIGDGVVGGLLEQQVAIGAEERQPAALPGFLILPRRVLPAWLPAPASC